MYTILLAGMKNAYETLASEYLAGLGHQTITARNTAEARIKLKEHRVDLVYLQASSDEAAILELKQLTADFPALPVVLLFTHAAAGPVLQAWHSGAADAIMLPVTSESVGSSLERAVALIAAKQEGMTPVRARLRYFDEKGEESCADIFPPRFTIGRSSTNSLVLNQMVVSRSHAEVLVRDGEYILRDLGSKLGTYLNGTRVEEKKLSSGDRIQLGGPQGISLVFEQGDLLQSLLSNLETRSEISLPVRGFKDIGMLLATFQALSSISLLDELLSLIVDTAIELTGTERGFIMLKDKSSELSFRCARASHRRPLDGSLFQTSRRIPGEVFKTGRCIAINDLDFSATSEEHGATRQLGLRSIYCVPLRYMPLKDSDSLSGTQGIENIGVLYVDSQKTHVGLSQTQINALETLATEAAVAIHNARLYRDSQEKRRMEEQLAIARELQQALLPKSDEELSYVRISCHNLPCHEVGGDYFDYFELGDGRFCFALGDVAGKGISAALLATAVQGIFSSQSFADASLSAIVSNLNRNLKKRGMGNRFVTSFFGILDPEGNCNYVNAGHNPPLLLHPDGTMEELAAGGTVLGLFAGMQYESGTITLQPEDHLVLFTDGVVEALSTAGEEFGQQRLITLLKNNARAPTPDLLARLRDAVLSFSAHAPQHDDISMMVLGYKESGARADAVR
jgi:serine phosphatase RsbU (regulator of sigma subunit)/pSer/pThr/pTyr-binding forkhead associated (FHA) protein